MIEKGTERKVMTIEREIEIEIEIGTGVGIEIESESESETGIERGRERGVGIGKKEIEITIGQAERGETMTEIGTVRGEAGVQGQIHMKDTGRAHLRERRTCQVICKSWRICMEMQASPRMTLVLGQTGSGEIPAPRR
jgi:hypothetical protein